LLLNFYIFERVPEAGRSPELDRPRRTPLASPTGSVAGIGHARKRNCLHRVQVYQTGTLPTETVVHSRNSFSGRKSDRRSKAVGGSLKRFAKS
jgi:hypothetical protein